MKNSGLIISIWGTILIFSSTTCSVESIDRQVSSPISCSSSIECFSIVDSLFQNINSSVTKWSILPKADSLINFHDYSNLTSNATILVKDFVEVPEAVDYLIRMGSDDGIRVFLNGVEVFRNTEERGVQPDSDWIVVSLLEGSNEIFFQINQIVGNWGLHYNIEPYDEEKLNNLIIEYIPEIYADLPESCILKDSVSHLAFKLDSRIKQDQFNILRVRWLDIFTNTSSEWIEFTAIDFPDMMELPEDFEGFKILEYELINQEDALLYKEKIPIFSRTVALQKAIDFKSRLQEDLSKAAYLENLALHYPELFGKEKELDFSTRHKAEFLLDLLLLENEKLSFNGGPRTELFNGKLLRTYTPYTHTESQELIVGFHVELEDTINHYFKTYAGKSHAKMVEWNSFVQTSGNTLITPFIKPGDKELSISAFNEHYLSSIEAENFELIKAISWSKGVPILLKEFTYDHLLYNEVHMISSWLMISKQEAFETANLIRKYNPTIELNFWHGNADTDVPHSYIDDWSATLVRNRLKSKVFIQPNSSHWSYFRPVEKKIIN